MDALLANIQALLSAATLLFRKRYFSQSAHLSIVCGEECAKYILEFCKKNLPDEVIRRRFQHLGKFRVLAVPWHVAGGLQVVYLLHALHEAGVFGEADADLVFDDLLDTIGQNNPQRLAETVMEYISRHQDGKVEAAQQRAAVEMEQYRRSSVYVDLDDDQKVVGQPADITRDVAKRYLINARVARTVVRFISSNEPDIVEFTNALPREMRDEARRTAREMIQKVLAARDANAS